jgi:hypothetical protein
VVCDSCRRRPVKVHVRFDDSQGSADFSLCLDCASLAGKQEVVGVLEAISGIREWCCREIASQ